MGSRFTMADIASADWFFYKEGFLHNKYAGLKTLQETILTIKNHNEIRINHIQVGTIPMAYREIVENCMKKFNDKKNRSGCILFAFAENTFGEIQRTIVSKSGGPFKRDSSIIKDLNCLMVTLATNTLAQRTSSASNNDDLFMYRLEKKILSDDNIELLNLNTWYKLYETKMKNIVSNGMRSQILDDYLKAESDSSENVTSPDDLKLENLLNKLGLWLTPVRFYIRVMLFKTEHYQNDIKRINPKLQCLRNVMFSEYHYLAKQHYTGPVFNEAVKDLNEYVTDFRDNPETHNENLVCAEDSFLDHMSNETNRNTFLDGASFITMFTIFKPKSSNMEYNIHAIIPPCSLCHTHFISDLCNSCGCSTPSRRTTKASEQDEVNIIINGQTIIGV